MAPSSRMTSPLSIGLRTMAMTSSAYSAGARAATGRGPRRRARPNVVGQLCHQGRGEEPGRDGHHPDRS